MLRSAAITWVQGNCPNPKLFQDVVRAIDEGAARGYDCFFIIGGKLTRKQKPFLLHCFADELFIFELTDTQAAARGVRPDIMCSGGHRRTVPAASIQPVIAIERFELKETVLRQSQPILGRIHYEVQAEGAGDYGVRLDYSVEAGTRTAWDYPQRSLWGKGMLDVAFLPIAPEPGMATDFRGPLAMFVHLVEMSPKDEANARRPISNCGATLVEIVDGDAPATSRISRF